jgi:hypothetical protein
MGHTTRVQYLLPAFPLLSIAVAALLTRLMEEGRAARWVRATGGEAVPATLMGAGIGQKMLLQSMACVLIGAVLLGTGGSLVMKWRRQVGGRQERGLTTPMASSTDEENAA